tara:strand:+ start:1134 stop:1289 length:156 start_codon:yes stop_codon:yes gene_type:complete
MFMVQCHQEAVYQAAWSLNAPGDDFKEYFVLQLDFCVHCITNCRRASLGWL